MMNEKTKPSDNQKTSENLETLDLPFTKARTELTGAYVRNAVPREEHYQTWLKQHYDMASSLGLEKDTTPGEGLALDTGSKKIKVKIDDNGGLAMTDKGLGVKCHITGSGDNWYAGALKCVNDEGVLINVGNPTNGRRGLKGYPDVGGQGVGLGIDYDASLKIDGNGKIGINTADAEATIKMMGKAYGATHYVYHDNLTLYLKQTVRSTLKVIAQINLKSSAQVNEFYIFPTGLTYTDVTVNTTPSPQTKIIGNQMGFVALVDMQVGELKDVFSIRVKVVDVKTNNAKWADIVTGNIKLID